MLVCIFLKEFLRTQLIDVLPVYVWVLSGYSGFLQLPKNMHVRLIGYSKFTLGVSVSVAGCVSHLSLCGPVIPSRVYPASCPMTARIGSRPKNLTKSGNTDYLLLSSPSAPPFWKLDRNISHTPWALNHKRKRCECVYYMAI